jgi:hypothetical protein
VSTNLGLRSFVLDDHGSLPLEGPAIAARAMGVEVVLEAR